MRESEILALQNIKGIGCAAISKLIVYLGDLGASTLLDIDFDALVINPDLSRYKKVFETNLHKDSLKAAINLANIEIESLERKGIRVIAITSDLYPQLLKLIKSPPTLLFCKGNIGLLSQNRNVALIGTRNNTQLGKLIAAKTTSFLVSSGFVIVSGLALGIDSIAHEKCLSSKGQTIAILVDVENVQPSKNKRLAEDILSHGGLLISENAPGIKIIPPLFVKRDRIQAGISLAVFPIETSINGGTMHAVKAAKQENRLIYVPNHTKSGYQDNCIEQISGIISLSHDADVEQYTRYSYPSIIKRLHQKENEIFSVDRVQGMLI
jgi:DNA processing protein